MSGNRIRQHGQADSSGLLPTFNPQKAPYRRITMRAKEQPGMPLVFGNVQHPPFIDRLIPDRQTSAWDDLGPRRPVGVCQHSMVGTLWGTDGWFRRGERST